MADCASSRQRKAVYQYQRPSVMNSLLCAELDMRPSLSSYFLSVGAVKFFFIFFVQQFFTPYPDSHHDTLRLHGALVQGEVSFSRCISSYCTTGWRLPPLLYLSIIVTFIDMNNRAARPLILHAARPLTLCINGVSAIIHPFL